MGTNIRVKAKSLPAPGKPFVLKGGNVTVKIYVGENRTNGVTYPQFTLAYYDGARRVKKNFTDLVEAKLANGEGQVLRLMTLDRANYLQAITDFTRRTHSVHEFRTVPELVTEYIASKEKAGQERRFVEVCAETRNATSCRCAMPPSLGCSPSRRWTAPSSRASATNGFMKTSMCP